MQNFQNLGAGGGGGDHFLTKPPKGTSLPDFTRFEPLCVRIRSRCLRGESPPDRMLATPWRTSVSGSLQAKPRCGCPA